MTPPRCVRARSFYPILFLVILLALLAACCLQLFISLSAPVSSASSGSVPSAKDVEGGAGAGWRAAVVVGGEVRTPTEDNCTYHTCFNVYRCPRTELGHMTVYVYPSVRYVDAAGAPLTLAPSREFDEILQTIRDSVYFVVDPRGACVLIPPLDLLNQDYVARENVSTILASLPWWDSGANHVLFNMLPGSRPDYNATLDLDRGRAIVAGGGYSTWTYRQTYDVSIPVYNPLVDQPIAEQRLLWPTARRWLAVSAQTGLHADYRRDLATSAAEPQSKAGPQSKARPRHQSLLLLDRCGAFNMSERCDGTGRRYRYPRVLQAATFCLVVRGNRLGQMALSDCLMSGSIPVIVADDYVPPFSEVLDWKRAALFIDESDLHNVTEILRAVSLPRVDSMRRQVEFLYDAYFSSVRAITLTTLRIINDRIFPYAALKYSAWNDPPLREGVDSPLFLPLIPPKSAGFTAVILTYDRQESLFKIIQEVSQAPSLVKVLVVWNNQLKAPPPASVWPKISKPLKVVQTRHNRLSNRFYPYDEIETEAILALDDDILMLTLDELEFGYEVWRQFSDRLVGFPSRLHLWDANATLWKYESEWTSEISMVLTGAAFYHKYYNYLYTNAMPGDIKTWVDEHMNCEDIAFNFLVANSSGKPPIKVAPRQKFRCGTDCLGGAAMLSADLGGHMVERSECIGRFTRIYGTMPLKTVEFRADPVLYRENFPPPDFKWFNDIGSL